MDFPSARHAVAHFAPEPDTEAEFVAPRSGPVIRAKEIAYYITNSKAILHNVRPSEVLTCSNPQ